MSDFEEDGDDFDEFGGGSDDDAFGDDNDDFGDGDDDDNDPFGGGDDDNNVGFSSDQESDPEEPDDPNMEISNKYCEAEMLFEDEDFESAISTFNEILVLEEKHFPADEQKMQMEDGACTFKALLYLCKIYVQNGDTKELKACFEQGIGLFKKDWVRDGDKENLMGVLDMKALDENHGDGADEIRSLVTGKIPKGPAWFKTVLASAFKDSEGGKTEKVDKILLELYSYVEEAKDATVELSVLALDSEHHLNCKKYPSMRKMYLRTKRSKFENVIMNGVIVGRMHLAYAKAFMISGKWKQAVFELDLALSAFNKENKTSRCEDALRLLVMVNMIVRNGEDPFNRNAARPLMSSTRVQALQRVNAAFDDNEIDGFQDRLLAGTGIADDAFAKQFAPKVMESLRTKMLIDITSPFDTVSLSYLEAELAIDRNSLMELMAPLILDDVLTGKIDQSSGFYFAAKGTRKSDSSEFYKGMGQWAQGLQVLQQGVLQRLENIQFRRKGKGGGLAAMRMRGYGGGGYGGGGYGGGGYGGIFGGGLF